MEVAYYFPPIIYLEPVDGREGLLIGNFPLFLELFSVLFSIGRKFRIL